MAHLDSLVVLDSNPQSSAALSFGFQREGFKVYSTSDSGDALAMAQARTAQLVVVSTQNAKENPLDLVGRLREEESTRELPIVVLGERRVREPALRAGADEFVARPAFIRDVVTLSKLAVAMRQDGDQQGVVGLLEDYGLYFLTRALAVAGRSAVVELERGKRRGEVNVNKGEVVAARLGRMSGLGAFNQLLLWGEAAMHLRFESPSGERKIELGADEVLEQGADFAKKFDKLAQRIGGAQAVYRQSPTRAAEARAKIPAEVMGLVKLYDGKRPFIDVVEDSPFKPHDTIKITYRLAELGAIEVVMSEHVDSPLTARLAVRDWLLGAPQQAAERSTVTEAGRRAAEAYAEEQARRAKEKPPAEDLGIDTMVDVPRPPLQAPKSQNGTAGTAAREANAPAASIHEQPTAPVSNRQKKKEKLKQKQQQRQQQQAKKPEAEPDLTIPFSKISVPPPSPAQQPEQKAEKPAPAPARKPGAAAPTRKQEGHSARHAKLSATAAASASGKEPVFSDDEAEFFAQEAELSKLDPVENFDDLESSTKNKSSKRSWFGWGGGSGSKPTKKR
jgi:ActR/RegA family two-component response regulator